MKYKDPAPVTCPKCTARSSHRVANLLALIAGCPNCGTALIQTGMKMRRGLDEWATFIAAICMTSRLEEKLGTKFSDDDVYGMKRLRDLARMIARESKLHADAESQSMELTQWAVFELARDSWWRPRGRGRPADCSDPLDLDAPLLDVIDPERWRTTNR